MHTNRHFFWVCVSLILIASAQLAPSMASTNKACADVIMSAKTAAELESSVTECLKTRVTVQVIHSELQKKAADLMKNKRQIAAFISEISKSAMRREDATASEKRISIVSSIFVPGVKPHLFLVGVSVDMAGEIKNVVIGVSDRPI